MSHHNNYRIYTKLKEQAYQGAAGIVVKDGERWSEVRGSNPALDSFLKKENNFVSNLIQPVASTTQVIKKCLHGKMDLQ